MADRYNKIMAIIPKSNVNCPIFLDKGALLKDNVSNKNLLQLQFCNLNEKTITAVKLSIDCIDVISNENSDIIDFSYLDLRVANNECFGSDIPIYIDKSNARDFKITVKKVIFDDGSSFSTDTVLINIDLPSNINQLGVLGNQLINDIHEIYPNVRCATVPQEHGDYWYCVCGAYNQNVHKCRECGCVKELILPLSNLEQLKNRFDMSEKERLESIRLIRKKRKKISIFSTLLVLVILGLAFGGIEIHKSLAYNDALNLIASDKYDDAIKELNKLGEYKDSKDMILQAKYEKAADYFSQEKYKDSYELFSEIGDYKDSAERKNESLYQNGKKLLNENNVSSAIDVFKQLGDYKESKAKLIECQTRLAEAETKNQNDSATEISNAVPITKENKNSNNITGNQTDNSTITSSEKDVPDFIDFISGSWIRPYDSGMHSDSGIISFSRVDDSHLNCYDDAQLDNGNIENAKITKISSMANTYYFDIRYPGGSTTDDKGNTYDYDMLSRYAITIVDDNTITIKGTNQAYKSDGSNYYVGGTVFTYHRQ